MTPSARAPGRIVGIAGTIGPSPSHHDTRTGRSQ